MFTVVSRWLLMLTLGLALAGCGFQLKGTTPSSVDSALSGLPIAVASSQPRSELTAAVVQQLRLEGAEIVDADANTLTLKLGNEVFQQRNLSLTAQARAAEVELTMLVRIDLMRDGAALIENNTATVVRQFLNDPRNIVGKTEELRLLRDEMRRELSAQITRRVTHSLGN